MDINDNWYQVDNVAKVFLATHSERDTRSLRVSCTLREKIDKESLQKALDKTIASRSLFQVRIRRGLFWHYIEQTNARPLVEEENGRVCPVLYGKNYRGTLHYKVSYYHNRINFEIFHALTDGTGAFEFLNLLVLNYLKLKHPKELGNISLGSGASVSELEQDSFNKFYEKTPISDSAGELSPTGLNKAYSIRGLKLPFNQLQFFKVRMPVSRLLEKAKEKRVSLTSYVGACLMLAIYRDMPVVKRNIPVTISVPVNLRNFYPSETARNFFNSVSISHHFDGTENLDNLCKDFDSQLKESLKPENIKKQMAAYQKIERLMFIRMIPLVLKQPVVRFFSKRDAKTVSAVVSNTGIIKTPDELHDYIYDYELLCSHNGFYLSMCTYGEYLTMGITSGYRNTGVLRDFLCEFTRDGIEAEVYSTEVIR